MLRRLPIPLRPLLALLSASCSCADPKDDEDLADIPWPGFGGVEICGDGIDNDRDGTVDLDCADQPAASPTLISASLEGGGRGPATIQGDGVRREGRGPGHRQRAPRRIGRRASTAHGRRARRADQISMPPSSLSEGYFMVWNSSPSDGYFVVLPARTPVRVRFVGVSAA